MRSTLLNEGIVDTMKKDTAPANKNSASEDPKDAKNVPAVRRALTIRFSSCVQWSTLST